MILNLSDCTPKERYHIMTQTIIPRPIAWVLTASDVNTKETFNLAPYSYFTAVSSNPPLLMFSAGHKSNGTLKDTVKNAIETKKLVIHISSTQHLDAVAGSAEELEHNTSEIQKLKLETVPFGEEKLPRLKDCEIAFSCSLYKHETIGDAPQHLIFAEIHEVYINDTAVIPDAVRTLVDPEKINPLTRLGGSEYSSLGKIQTKKRG